MKDNNLVSDTDVIFEGMTSISALIKARHEGISDRPVYKILYDKDKIEKIRRQIDFLRNNAANIGYDICPVSGDVIFEITSGITHGGIVAICGPRSFKELTQNDIITNGLYFCLEGIEDPYNFGDSLRSLYASGVDGVILSHRNWLGGTAGVVARASAGASELLPCYVSTPENAAALFTDVNYTIVTAGIRDSVSLFDTDLKKPLLVVVGGEKRGVSRAFLDKAVLNLKINYGRDFRGSLSTSASAAVMAFEIMRKINFCN